MCQVAVREPAVTEENWDKIEAEQNWSEIEAEENWTEKLNNKIKNIVNCLVDCNVL